MSNPGEEQAFVAAILARPSDDSLRLILADYLEESGNPADIDRAELIRIQVALSRIWNDHPQFQALTDRQNELFIRRHDEWTRHLHGWRPVFNFGVVCSIP